MKLGKAIPPLELNEANLAKAVIEILNDDGFLERMIAFSKVSRKYDGNVRGAGEIVRFLNTDGCKKVK